MAKSKEDLLSGDLFSGHVPAAVAAPVSAGICPVCHVSLYQGSCINRTCPRVNLEAIPRSHPTVYPATDRALARNIHPETSHKAAASIGAVTLGILEGKVLDALARRGAKGGTCDEIAADLDAEKTTVSPRFVPLERKDLIHNSGRTRAGRSGRSMTVWVYGKKAR